jgi:hypothetical protein
MRQSALGGVKNYLLVRWKKRWPIVPVTAICILLWTAVGERRRMYETLLEL